MIHRSTNKNNSVIPYTHRLTLTLTLTLTLILTLTLTLILILTPKLYCVYGILELCQQIYQTNLLMNKINVMWSSKMSLKSKNMIFVFLAWHFLSGYCFGFNLVKTPQRLGNWFQRYKQLKDWTNNKKQKKLSALFGCTLKTVFVSSDSFCLITWQMLKIVNPKCTHATMVVNLNNVTLTLMKDGLRHITLSGHVFSSIIYNVSLHKTLSVYCCWRFGSARYLPCFDFVLLLWNKAYCWEIV